MTVDIATLGIAVDVSQVKRAVSDLDALGVAGDRVSGKARDINSAFKQFNDGLFAHERAAKAAAEAEKQLLLQQQALGQVATPLTSGQVHFIDALKEQATQAGKTGAELLRLKAAQLGMADEAAPYIAQIESASSSTRKFSFHTAEARESVTSLIRSAASGDVTQFGASLTTLAGRSGVLRLAMSGTGLAIAGMTAAVGAGLFVMYQMENQAAELANALTVTGNAAGLTAASFDAMVESVGKGGNLADARTALLALVATGRMSSEAMESVGKAAVSMARLTGQSAEDVGREYAKMADGVVKFVDDHEKSQNLLTTSQYQHIRALEEEGRAQEAMTAYGKYVDDALDKNTAKLGVLHKALRDAKDGWDNFWKKAMAFDPNSVQFKIDTIISEINMMNAGFTGGRSNEEIKAWGKEKTDELKRLYKIQNDEEAAAEEKAAAARRAAEGKEAVRQIDAIHRRYESKKEAETREIKEYKDYIEKMMLGGGDNVPSDDKQAEIIAGIKKKYLEVDNSARALSQTQINAAAQLRDIELKGAADSMQTKRALGEIDQIQFDRNMSNLALEGIASRQLVERQMLGIKGLSAAERAAHEAKLKGLEQAFLLEEQRGANKERVTDKAAFDGTVKAVIDDGYAKAATLDAAIQKQREYNAEIGLTAERVRQLAAERFAADTKALQGGADFIRNAIAENKYVGDTLAIYQLRLSMLDAEIAKRNQLAGFKQAADDKAGEAEQAAKMTQQLEQAAQSARAFGDAMAESFGNAGKAVGGVVKAMTSYGLIQDKIAREQKQALAGTTDKKKIEEINAKAAEKSAQAQINQYGDMARAAKGFFKEGSKGYAALEAAEKTFRAVELAMAIETHLTKSGLLAAFTGLFATAKTTEVAAQTATLAPTIAVETAKQGVYGTTGLAAALSLPFPANLPAFAIVAAMLASIGVAVAGASGGSAPAAPPLHEVRQKAQGTGTVLGDASAKSQSVENSLALIEQNSEIELTTQMGMLRALRNIESALGSAAARVFQTTGLTGGSAFGTTKEDKRSFFGSDTTQDIADTGVRISGTFGQLRTGAGRGEQYEDVNHTSDGGWFHGDKAWTTTNVKGLDAATMRPFTIIFNEMGNVLVAAGEKLGGSVETMAARINAVPISFGASTRGLTGNDLTAALAAGVSVAMDEVAMVMFNELDGSTAAREAARRGTSGDFMYDEDDPLAYRNRSQGTTLGPLTSALTDFQKVGEGAGETLVRLASNYDALDAIMKAVGMTFGAVGIASLRAREDFIDLAGGLDELASKTASFASNYLTEEERLAPVRKHVTDELARLGHASVTTRDQFKALVLAQDTSTVAGRDLYLALLDIEQAFADTHAAAEDLSRSAEDIAEERRGLQDQLDQLTMTRAQLRAKERMALAAENRALFDVLTARQDIADAYERESQALTTTIDRLKQLGTTLSSFLNGLDQGNLSALTPMEKMEEARRVYEETLAKAKAGDAAAQGQITQAASNYLSADRVVNASSPTYTADFERVKNDLRNLMATAGTQLSEAEQQLASMKTLTGTLINLDESTVSLTDAINALHAAIMAQPGAGQIEGLYQSVLGRAPDTAGLEFWTNAYNSGTSMTDITSGFVNSPEKQISDLYKNILGRAPDQQGLTYWMQRADSGMTIDQIAAAFKQSDEYLAMDGSHASGLERVPFDGYKAELHAGEAVIDAPAMAALSRYFGAPSGQQGGGNTAALVAEIRALREEVAMLRAEQERQTGQIVHGNLTAAERSADKAASSAVEAARAQAWALAQREKAMVK